MLLPGLGEELGDGEGRRVTHSLGLGMAGVVYWVRLARGYSHRLGAQTPMRTRQVAMSRLACS